MLPSPQLKCNDSEGRSPMSSMPSPLKPFKDKDGNLWEQMPFMAKSYKSQVLNLRLQKSQFAVSTFTIGKDSYNEARFACDWCGRWLPESSFHGDHMTPKALEKLPSYETKRLFLGDNEPWNLLAACVTCNASTRNEAGVHTRSSFSMAASEIGPQKKL